MLVDKTNFGSVFYNHTNFYQFEETSSYWSVKRISAFLCFSLVNQRHTSGITVYIHTVTNIKNTVQAMHSCLPMLIDKTNFGSVFYNHTNFYQFEETSSYWSVKRISAFLYFSLVNQRHTSGITVYIHTVTNIKNTVQAMHSCPPMLIDKTNFGSVFYNHANFYRFEETSSYWSVKQISIFLGFSLVNQRHTSGITVYNCTVTNIENTVRVVHSCNSWFFQHYDFSS